VSNIFSKHHKELEAWDAKMKIVDKEEAAKDIKSKVPKRGPTLMAHFQGFDEAKNLFHQLII
jgi:hypothetical protein